MYTYAHICTYIRTNVRTYHIHTDGYLLLIHFLKCKPYHTHTHTPCARTHTHTHTHIRMHMHARKHTRIHTMHVSKALCVCSSDIEVQQKRQCGLQSYILYISESLHIWIENATNLCKYVDMLISFWSQSALSIKFPEQNTQSHKCLVLKTCLRITQFCVCVCVCV